MSIQHPGPPAEPDFPCRVGCIVCGAAFDADGEDDPCPVCDEVEERTAAAFEKLEQALKSARDLDEEGV